MNSVYRKLGMALLLIVAGAAGAWVNNSCSAGEAAAPNAGHIRFIEHNDAGAHGIAVYCDTLRHNLIYQPDIDPTTSLAPSLTVVSGGC